MTHVLVVEDERALRRALAMNLVARGYEVTDVDGGTKALAEIARRAPDVVLLDLGLPDLDGLDVIRAVRVYSAVPIIVLTARTDTAEKVTALDLGADDYVTKPFAVDELLARVRAAARRSASPHTTADAVEFGQVRVDLVAMTVTRDGAAVHLTPTEWRLLTALARHPDTLVTGRSLLTELRGGPDNTDSSYLRIYMAALRRKLEPDPGRPEHLITETGMGYRLVTAEPAASTTGRLSPSRNDPEENA